jgi:capsular polysaccharide transport system ATP-binding protein
MLKIENVSQALSNSAGQESLSSTKSIWTVAAGEKIGILGRNGAGKSTLDTADQRRRTSKRWHDKENDAGLLAAGVFGRLPGLADRVGQRCASSAGSTALALKKGSASLRNSPNLDAFMREPLKTYSSGMRARLAFALSMAIEFDCFLIDEVITVGDARFHEKCRKELFEKRK